MQTHERKEGTIRCYQLFHFGMNTRCGNRFVFKVMKTDPLEPWDGIGQSETGQNAGGKVAQPCPRQGTMREILMCFPAGTWFSKMSWKQCRRGSSALEMLGYQLKIQFLASPIKWAFLQHPPSGISAVCSGGWTHPLRGRSVWSKRVRTDCQSHCLSNMVLGGKKGWVQTGFSGHSL